MESRHLADGRKIVTVRIGQEGLDFVKICQYFEATSTARRSKSVKDAADGESYVKPIEFVLSGSTATLPGTDFTLKVESSNEAFGLAISGQFCRELQSASARVSRYFAGWCMVSC